MDLLYKNEHLGCINYEQNKRPLIELITIEKNELWEKRPLENQLVFLLSGEIISSFGKFRDCPIHKKQIIYLPSDYHFSCKSLEKSTLMFFCLRGCTQFCDSFRFEDLVKYPYKSQENIEEDLCITEDIEEKEYILFEDQYSTPNTLEINEVMDQYLDFLKQCITTGLRCKFFYSIKMKELFYIFRCFYPKEALNRFFCQVLNSGTEFASYILENSHQYKSVKELADAMNYTVSGFEKRFKRVFEISPYKWMTNQKAEKIYHEISTSEQTFKQISYNFGFTSLSHFNDFCKAKLGKTPRDIRRNRVNGENAE